MIEAAAGEPVGDVLRDRIVEPLGMEDTYFAWSEPVEEPVVPGELELPNGMRVPVGSEFIPSLATWGWTAGGAVSSARDQAIFFGALFDGLLAPESVDAMKTGLGVVTTSWPDGKEGWYHDGLVLGWVCAAGVNEAGWAVAVLTNRVVAEDLVEGRSTSTDPTELVDELLGHLAAEE